MRIVFVGGVERTEELLTRVAADFGDLLVYHSGHVGGAGSGNLRLVIERADLVIIQTDVNSHGAVQVARKEARRAHRETILLRRCSPSKLRSILAEAHGVAAA